LGTGMVLEGLRAEFWVSISTKVEGKVGLQAILTTTRVKGI